MEKESSSTVSETHSTDSDNLATISGLREQIKSNAGLLFPHGANGRPQLAYDVVVMTSGQDRTQQRASGCCYKAVLTFPGGFSQGMRAGSLAARGPSRSSVIQALEALLDVTASALEMFQGNVMKDAEAPMEVAGGIIDESLIRGKSSWKGMIGGTR